MSRGFWFTVFFTAGILILLSLSACGGGGDSGSVEEPTKTTQPVDCGPERKDCT